MNSGGFTALWLDTTLVYRLTIRTVGGTLVQTIDGVQVGGGGGGGGGSSQWVTSGNNIYNSNSGDVSIGTNVGLEKLTVSGNLDLQGELRIRNSDTTSHEVGFIAQSGMVSDIRFSLPTTLPGSTSCFQVSTAGIISYIAGCTGGGGGGGSGSGLYSQTFAAVSSATLTHNLNSTDLLIACYDNGTPELLIALTATYPKLTDANNADVAWTGAKTGHCVVNAGGGDSLWSKDVSNNITLTDSLTAVSSLRAMNQTASTGVTSIIVQAGAGQVGALTPLISFRNNAGTEFSGIDYQGAFFTQQQLISQDGSGTGSAVNGAISSGISLSNTKAIQWSSDATWYGTPDLGVNRNAAGVMEINNGTPGTFRDLHIRNLTIDGTCTGAACGGGGGGGLPASDATSLVYKSTDMTAQMRISAANIPASTTGVLTVKAAASYVLPGENIANTWGASQTFAGNILFTTTGKNIGTTAIPSGSTYSDTTFVQTLKVAGPGTSFGASYTFTATSNALTLRNQSSTAVTTWSCPGSVCQTTFGSTNVEVDGTSSGILLPLIITDTNNSPGLNLYATSTREATWSASATVAFDVRNQSDLHRFLVFQNGDTQIGTSTTDQGYALYVAGNIFATGNITCGGTCGGGGGGGANTALSNLALVGVNTTLLPDTDLLEDLGSTAKRWKAIESSTVTTRNGSAGAAGSGYCRMASSGYACANNLGTTIFDYVTNAQFLRTYGGQMLMNRTTDDGTGALLQIAAPNAGTVSALSVNGSGNSSLVRFFNTSLTGAEVANFWSLSTASPTVAVISGSATTATLLLNNSTGIYAGAGAPVGACSNSSLFLRQDGTGTSIYACKNSVWAALN